MCIRDRSGSVLNGYEITDSLTFLGFYHNQISAISDEVPDTFLNWLMPGSKLHSKLGAFISSWVKPDEFEFNTALNGSNRGIVPVAAYEEGYAFKYNVTPVVKIYCCKRY